MNTTPTQVTQVQYLLWPCGVLVGRSEADVMIVEPLEVVGQ